MKKIGNLLFSMQLTGMLLVIFGVVIAAATFIENDFGTSAAKVIVFNSLWFELLLLLIAVNLIGSVITRKMYKREKLTIFIFHMAFIIIILGAGITRFFGYEGTMHIREGKSSDYIMSGTKYVSAEIIQNGKSFLAEKEYMAANTKGNKLNMRLKHGDHKITVKVKKYVQNAYEKLVESSDGVPMMHIVLFDGSNRQDLFIPEKESREAAGLIFSYNNDIEGAINMSVSKDNMYFVPLAGMSTYDMMKDVSDSLIADSITELKKMLIYSLGEIKFVVNEVLPSAKIELLSAGKEASHYDALMIEANVNGESKEGVLYYISGTTTKAASFEFKDLALNITYGSKMINLPFQLKLNDFVLERYPGSESPSSFTSKVTLIDRDKNINKETSIFMNNVLNHRGYRFFQSSYDSDEQGTILSVNHDFWGTWITYLGYILLALGMVLSLFNKKSRFSALLKKKEWNATTKITSIFIIFLIGFLFFNTNAKAQVNTPQTVGKYIAPSVGHAKKFGEILVQDHAGRIEPINTLASEVLRKIARKTSWEGLTPDQVLLGMITNPDHWKNVPMIKISHPEVKKILGVTTKRVSFTQIVDFSLEEDAYKLERYVKEANQKKPAERNKFDKDVIAIDERLNITYLIFINNFLKIFPDKNDQNNKWYAPSEAQHIFMGDEAKFVMGFVHIYSEAVKKASKSNNWKEADQMLNALKLFQEKNGKEVIPPKAKIKLELKYNKWNLFNKLEGFYGMFGFLLLILHFMGLLIPRFRLKWIVIVSAGIIILAFALHTMGLGIRWYISGHAPWSNAYESMIFIAWATVLAGIIFVKRSPIALTATALLSSMILSVAHLNWLDPEVTNLVPVLKSYWLVIHVAIITSSYGFLALGALLGFFSMIVMILMTKNNYSRLRERISEMTSINEITLIVGLYLLTIGTFLGGVWANESWGRYWGWDSKETWALVTVVVYSFILHMRFIPGLRGVYAYNLASLIGYFSVIMTYFGVNYYLSGLHSYATGDPVPVPAFVYYTLTVIFIVGVISYLRFNKLEKSHNIEIK